MSQVAISHSLKVAGGGSFCLGRKRDGWEAGTYASLALVPICMRISFAVPMASSTLLTTWVARARRGFVRRLLLHQLGVRENDAELIVQPMEKIAKFRRLSHCAPIEQIRD